MKHIAIVGASRGIGKELVRILSKEHKVLALSRDLNKLKTIQAEENSKNISVTAVNLSAPNVKDYLKSVFSQAMPKIDLLINNAGYLVNKPVLELTEEDLHDTFNTNVIGLIQSCQAAIPHLSPGSHIVNIGSMGGFQGSSKFPGLSAYSGSKSAVAGFSECLAEELKEELISVNCLALGAAQTEMLEEAFPGYEAPVSAHKMAEYIADFGLHAHGWLNGKVIPVSLSTP